MQCRIELIHREGEATAHALLSRLLLCVYFRRWFSEYAVRQCSRGLKKPP